MFYSLTGNIIHKGINFCALDCSGVAFYVQISDYTSKEIEIGKKATLFTYMNVREDAIELFGFINTQELDCFKQLISVSGIGSKAAIAILSVMSPSKLSLCITSGDWKSITQAKGVGAKIAQRLVNELKDKVSAISGEAAENISSVDENSNNNISEAVSALAMLGYSRSEAALAVSKLSPELKVQDLIKQALALLTKRY